MTTINCTVEELEDTLEQLYDNDDVFVDETEVSNDETEEGMILVSGIYINIPSLGISAREGTFCNYDEDSGEYMPDFSITLIYDADEKNPEKFLYWEQDSIAIAVYNFLRKQEYSLNDIYSAKCVIEY